MYEQAMNDWIELVRPLFPANVDFAKWDRSGVASDNLCRIEASWKDANGKKSFVIQFEPAMAELYERTDVDWRAVGNSRVFAGVKKALDAGQWGVILDVDGKFT